MVYRIDGRLKRRKRNNFWSITKNRDCSTYTQSAHSDNGKISEIGTPLDQKKKTNVKCIGKAHRMIFLFVNSI